MLEGHDYALGKAGEENLVLFLLQSQKQLPQIHPRTFQQMLHSNPMPPIRLRAAACDIHKFIELSLLPLHLPFFSGFQLQKLPAFFAVFVLCLQVMNQALCV
uniref:Uncharacterized protein n=1 Tax=Globodera rostochiensis TaxID=31243 RepID=A0A914IFJ0_GLORO